MTYENGKQRQDVWSKCFWTAPKVGAGAAEPVRFTSGNAPSGAGEPVRLTKEQSAELQGKNMAKSRNEINNSSIDKPSRNDIIETRGYVEDNFSRKISPSTIEEDLKEVNPNYKKAKGYDDNCQRCVPTYVLRKRGYNVEALPTGQNESVDTLLKQNPHIIWQKAGSPVIPKSTRGSRYFGKPEIEKYMKDLPDGAMCEIRCEWKNEDYGHVFIAEKQNGKVRYIDPQNNNTDAIDYFNDMKLNRTQFWRIDNATLDDDLIKYCCKSKGGAI